MSVIQVIKSVSIRQAIRWVAQAWEAVKKETISKCFRKAGILDENFALISREYEEHDPFGELNSQPTSDELENLIHQLNMPAETRCSVSM